MYFKDEHDDLLNLIGEIKGFRGEDAKDKANTMENYWIPGVNNLDKFRRWQFVEFTEVFEIMVLPNIKTAKEYI